jgi:DNA-binding MarR family transcriptional regulator
MATRSYRRSTTTAAAPSEDHLQRRQLVEEAAAFASAYLRWLEAAASGGLSYPRVRLLEALGCEGPAMMRALGERLGLSPRNMTALVDSLEDEGLVRRRPHPSDRRALLIELTGEGVGVATAAFEQRITAVAEVFDDLSAEDQKAFLELMGGLRAALRRRGVRG